MPRRIRLPGCPNPVVSSFKALTVLLCEHVESLRNRRSGARTRRGGHGPSGSLSAVNHKQNARDRVAHISRAPLTSPPSAVPSRSDPIFESSESTGQLELNILGSGHLLVSQGQELLEGFSLLNAQSFLKIQHKSDSLLFNITIKAPEDAPRAAPAVAMGPLSIKHLSQYFLGERELSLPMAYHQCTLPSGDLEALLRLCLLDSGFPPFVEEVEKKLKELMQE
ncbi:meiotic recombination protein REC114 isoform X1 [Labeo rohita]|uniref:Meiotic recombination protein REC114 isoform X1 n=1 Tax=Labeo rohita TaxID=84645 RepID=A0A498LFW6_LABRO|nr:meiotic recombination protein REC114 isoform X1 [Labeo rohita]